MIDRINGIDGIDGIEAPEDVVGSRVPRDRPPKKFAIIGNQNSLMCKEVFPLIRQGRMWLGQSIHSGDRQFGVPDFYELNAATCGVDEFGKKFIRVKGVRWFTNIEHGRRHEHLNLLTMRDNIKYSRHKEVKGVGYQHYDNYDAIEVPYTDAIPSDYDGVMDVPITFLDKYCPERFEILGTSLELAKPMSQFAAKGTYQAGGPRLYLEEANGPYAYRRLYARILIRRRKP